MHTIRKVFLSTAKKTKKDAPSQSDHSYGLHEFIRMMIIYCLSGGYEKAHLSNL